jgi:transcriptional regulator with XRE-family HTH domain
MRFTERLTVLLKAKKMTRKALSEATGIKYGTLNSWYVRNSSNINSVTLQKLASFFGIEMDILLSPSVNEKRLLQKLNRDREMLSNVKTDQLKNEIESLKTNPDITEFDIQIAKCTASLDISRKAQIFLFINHFKRDLEEGKNVIISIGTGSNEKVI